MHKDTTSSSSKTPIDLLSNKAKGLKRKSDRNKKRNSLAHTIARKTDFSRRFYGTAQRVAKFKIEKQEYLKRKSTQEKRALVKPESEGKSSTKMQSDEGRNSRAFAKMTKPELLLYESLRELGFEIEREFKLSAKYFDFHLLGHKNQAINDYVKRAKILIECDGAYWHSKDPNNVTLKQMTQRIEDTYKNAIALARGYELIRVWENEISKDSLRDMVNDKLLKRFPKEMIQV